MDEYTAEAFANRDDPLPLISVTHSDGEGSSSEVDKGGKQQRLRQSLSASKLKSKAQDLRDKHLEKVEDASESGLSLQDRIFAKLLQQMIPSQDVDNDVERPVDKRSSEYVRRPAFSLPVMTNNFRRFNARIGIVFVFQNRMIRLFTWTTTTHTLSFLAVYTFICLDPYLLTVLPLIVALFFIMIPAFVARHPAPPASQSTSSITPYAEYTYSGPALAPAKTIKPASETSKDFFRNMRDLQNSMADFANVHDTLIKLIAPATNFSDETRSSVLFLWLTILTTALFISSQLFPWRLIFLVGGHALIISSHPTAQTYLANFQKRAEKQAKVLLDPSTVSDKPQNSHDSNRILGISPSAIPATIQSLSAITLSTSPVTREVEVFELQHRPLLPPPTSKSTTPVPEWTPHLFTSTPYDPLSPHRISGSRSQGTRFFEDVQAPAGWAWRDKKWMLDLEPGEWVNERLIVGVGFEDPHFDSRPAGDRAPSSSIEPDLTVGGWVWDLPPIRERTREEDVWLAYGDYDVPKSEKEKEKERQRNIGHKKNNSSLPQVKERDWEEIVRYDSEGRERTGEWRRRRWIRVVQRVSLEAK